MSGYDHEANFLHDRERAEAYEAQLAESVERGGRGGKRQDEDKPTRAEAERDEADPRDR